MNAQMPRGDFRNRRGLRRLCVVLFVSVVLHGCGGGTGSAPGGGESGAQGNSGAVSANFGCDGGCAHGNLAGEEVTRILEQGVAAAEGEAVACTFAVLDRVGNVLAVYQMEGAPRSSRVDGQIGGQGGLEGAVVPATLVAISKAGTGAYLSSQGNAFSTRTASQIVQEHFLPGQRNQPAGPLFGVQFSSLPCGDVVMLNPELSSGAALTGKSRAGGSVGPRPLPLGLSADPGGIPLYKRGDLVGGVGVECNGVYTLDRSVADRDRDSEELLALAASVGFEAPQERVADTVFVGGRALRFTDVQYSDVGAAAGARAALSSNLLQAVPLYAAAQIRAGVRYGEAGSGVATTRRAGQKAEVLVDGAGVPRFPSRAGRSLPGGVQLSAAEVEALLDAALVSAYRLRAAIRNPRDSAARNTIFIVDDQGTPIGFTRSQDAPVFSLDVALQKARTVVLLSATDAHVTLSQAAAQGGLQVDYAAAFERFTGGRRLDGAFAFASRSVGNLARPFFVDGINGRPEGPFSLPFPAAASAPSQSPRWSPFNTGLQLDLIAGGIVQPLIDPQAVPSSCGDSAIFGSRIRNGIQIFPGAVPLYRDGVLIGGIGVSGDGIDQDDLIAFYGASRAGLNFVGHTTVGDPELGFNAPPQRRADTLPLPQRDSRLRYVSCPEAPFVGDNDQNVCAGL